MESRVEKVYAPLNKKIALKVIPGHFATSNSHINLYIDLTTMKTRLSEAMEAAKFMAKQYVNTVMVDTIVCLDGCEMIGGFLAHELTNAGIQSMNQHQTMYIISPEINTSGQMIFRESNQSAVYGKHILLLVASATTGDTIKKSLECIRYYGGKIQGVSAIFSAVKEVEEVPVHSIFKAKDLPNYQSYQIDECPLCKAKQKLDAIVSVNGYMKLK